MAAFFGVSRDTVRKDWKARGMPWPEKDGDGYDLRLIVGWRIGDVQRKNSARDDSGDPEMDGVESPNLERYRLAKAQLAEHELSKKRGEVIDAATMQALLGRVAEVIRGLQEQLERGGNADAAALINDALVDLQREYDSFFGDTAVRDSQNGD